MKVPDFKTVYFCGYAKLPTNMSANNVFGQITLGLLIDMETGIIVDLSCTLLSPLAIQMVQSYMVNRHIINDFDNMVSEISYRHQGNAQRPLIKALSDIRRRYVEFVEEYQL
jgi:hypothetical protein